MYLGFYFFALLLDLACIAAKRLAGSGATTQAKHAFHVEKRQKVRGDGINNLVRKTILFVHQHCQEDASASTVRQLRQFQHRCCRVHHWNRNFGHYTATIKASFKVHADSASGNNRPLKNAAGL